MHSLFLVIKLFLRIILSSCIVLLITPVVMRWIFTVRVLIRVIFRGSKVVLIAPLVIRSILALKPVTRTISFLLQMPDVKQLFAFLTIFFAIILRRYHFTFLVQHYGWLLHYPEVLFSVLCFLFCWSLLALAASKRLFSQLIVFCSILICFR